MRAQIKKQFPIIFCLQEITMNGTFGMNAVFAAPFQGATVERAFLDPGRCPELACGALPGRDR